MKRNFQILFILLFVLTGIISPGPVEQFTPIISAPMLCNTTSASVLTTFGETCLTMASTPGNSGKTRYVK